MVPLKVKLHHTEKTNVGLLLAAAANKARLDVVSISANIF